MSDHLDNWRELIRDDEEKYFELGKLEVRPVEKVLEGASPADLDSQLDAGSVERPGDR